MKIEVNIKDIRTELSLLVCSIREMKRRRTESGQPNWLGGEYRELYILKEQATIWYMILAHRHNRVHQKEGTLEKQEEELTKMWHRNHHLWRNYFTFSGGLVLTSAA